MNKVTIEMLFFALTLIPFLVLSFFFSGTETAFFSLNKLERESFKRKHSQKHKSIIKRIFSSPEQILVTVLTGNMIVNVFATDFFASMLSERISGILGGFNPDLFSILVMTPILLICGEMTPKNFAVRHPLKFANFAVVPYYFIEIVLKPFTLVLNSIRSALMKNMPRMELNKKELLGNMVSFVRRFGYKAGILNRFELELFESYFELQNDTAFDVMSPRTEIRGIDISTGLPKLMELMKTDPVFKDETVIYVYRDNLDSLLGYIDVKDLLPFKYGIVKDEHLTSVLKPFYLIPDTKKLSSLIVDMKESNREIALVIDEYGGTAGIITFHNLVKNMLDYFYFIGVESIRKVSDTCYYVDGKVEVDALKDIIDVEFHSEMRTVSGIIIEQLGEIPEKGTSVNIQGIEFEVVKTGKKRILDVRIWIRK